MLPTDEQKQRYRSARLKKYKEDIEYRRRLLRRNKEYSEKHHAQRLRYWNKRNRDPKFILKRRATSKRLFELPPEKVAHMREIRKAYVFRNAARLSAYWKAYRAAHADKTKAHNKANWHKRRAMMSKSMINPKSIKLFIYGARSRPTAICYYCKRRVSTKHIHFDHIIPLSRGGSHSVENLCISCRHCNRSKHAKLLRDFVTLGQQLLEL